LSVVLTCYIRSLDCLFDECAVGEMPDLHTCFVAILQVAKVPEEGEERLRHAKNAFLRREKSALSPFKSLFLRVDVSRRDHQTMEKHDETSHWACC